MQEFTTIGPAEAPPPGKLEKYHVQMFFVISCAALENIFFGNIATVFA